MRRRKPGVCIFWKPNEGGALRKRKPLTVLNALIPKNGAIIFKRRVLLNSQLYSKYMPILLSINSLIFILSLAPKR